VLRRVNGVSLLVVQGSDQGARFGLETETVLIGRGSHHAIRLSDSEVSHDHARLEFRNGQWFILDLGSANGTFVNGEGVDVRQLRTGDHLQLGRTVLLFQQAAPLEDRSSISSIQLLEASELPSPPQIVGSIANEPNAVLSLALSEWNVSRRAAANLQLLYQVTEEIVRPSTSLDDLLHRLLELALPTLGADRGCMLVANAKTDRIEPRIVVHRPGLRADDRFPVSRSIVQYVIQNGTAVRTSDARRDQRFTPGESILSSGIREALCAPMHGQYELLGVIYVDTTTAQDWKSQPGPSRFDDEQLALLAAIGRQAAAAIESARYHQALLQSERLAAVGKTTAVLSHHIKNILQGIRGGSYLIDRGLKDTSTSMIQKGWKIVERNQERIYRLVMDMLSFSKDRRPVLAAANLNDVVNDVCDLMQTQADDLQVALIRELSPAVPVSAFDAEGIHRAILNLVVNGLEALDGAKEATLTITTHYDSQAGQLGVEVVDNGPGIAEDELAKLFNIFESTKGERGTGLGLAVSQKILREHGGELNVLSEVGRGTRFIMTWPRGDAVEIGKSETP
jgi:signal transduction histidine kinase/pSer/pThr/pTyr-binding forkhead associated (FHA) protein